MSRRKTRHVREPGGAEVAARAAALEERAQRRRAPPGRGVRSAWPRARGQAQRPAAAQRRAHRRRARRGDGQRQVQPVQRAHPARYRRRRRPASDDVAPPRPACTARRTPIRCWSGSACRASTGSATSRELDSGDDRLQGLVLLDLPDHDSTEVAHHLEVDRLVELVDVFVWVTDPQKYADAALHRRYLAPLAGHDSVTVVVLNQADRLTPEALESLPARPGAAGRGRRPARRRGPDHVGDAGPRRDRAARGDRRSRGPAQRLVAAALRRPGLDGDHAARARSVRARCPPPRSPRAPAWWRRCWTPPAYREWFARSSRRTSAMPWAPQAGPSPDGRVGCARTRCGACDCAPAAPTEPPGTPAADLTPVLLRSSLPAPTAGQRTAGRGRHAPRRRAGRRGAAGRAGPTPRGPPRCLPG